MIALTSSSLGDSPGGGLCEERSSHANSCPGNRESIETPGCYGAGKGRQDAGSFRSYIRGSGYASAPRERKERQETGWWPETEQSPAVSTRVSGSDIWGKFPQGLVGEQINDLQLPLQLRQGSSFLPLPQLGKGGPERKPMYYVPYSLTNNPSQRGQCPIWQNLHVSQSCLISSQMCIPLKPQALLQALPHGTSSFL